MVQAEASDVPQLYFLRDTRESPFLLAPRPFTMLVVISVAFSCSYEIISASYDVGSRSV